MSTKNCFNKKISPSLLTHIELLQLICYQLISYLFIMKIEANSPSEYLNQLPDDRKLLISKLRAVILQNLPEGVEEAMSYGMIGFVIPHSVYSKGYHCNPKLPLPFMAIASQKNHIALYQNCIYIDQKLNDWFISEYTRIIGRKPDMGKGCIRFKHENDIPFELIAELTRKTTVKEYIKRYEDGLKSSKEL